MSHASTWATRAFELLRVGIATLRLPCTLECFHLQGRSMMPTLRGGPGLCDSDLVVGLRPGSSVRMVPKAGDVVLLVDENGRMEPKKVAGGAYGQFLAEKRPELQAECKGQPITAVTKLASKKFKALSEKERAVYQEKYLAAKAKYDEDMKTFLANGGEKKARKSREDKADKKKKKDPDAPKKPAGGAYGCWLAKNRPSFQAQCKGQPVTAITKLASAKWKELSAKEKAVFEDEYKKKLEEYQEAKKSYVPPAADDDAEEPSPKRRKAAKEDEAKAEPKAKAKAAPKAASPKGKEKAKAKRAISGNHQNVKRLKDIVFETTELTDLRSEDGTWHRSSRSHLRGWCWVEGDNALLSEDSRMFGWLPSHRLEAVAVAVVWPLWRSSWLSARSPTNAMVGTQSVAPLQEHFEWWASGPA
ncbi:unnamed protein product [Cladocopium goreaui]|uniref:FACT complex subunit SSRP1 (Facilitates chromatin transcription complex subunit SSRP1) (Structure-specific recognition protein 1) n=1 Tax=Cladocopium goreaui TaxID=2562237 RepID=A0A9P1GT16_9DINO|nr:unnamed protein product [Cladocopium goreaui]